MEDRATELKLAKKSKWRHLLVGCAVIIGPGTMVMLADTDVGSVVTAAQSGVQWGYSMIVPELILVPILYLIQEITVRLGIITGRGHGQLIRERFGWGWALLSVSTLFLTSVGALITEFSGIAGVGVLVSVPSWLSVGFATIILVAIGISGRYQRVEWIGIGLGSLELAFVVTAIEARPRLSSLVHGLVSVPVSHSSYVFLLAANVGAVIMPWMIFYQQGAVIDKKWTAKDLKLARVDTAVGAIITQVLMIAVVVTAAATLGRLHINALQSIPQIANSLEVVMGKTPGKLIFGAGILGAGFVAALVASLAGAWGIGEAFGFNHSLNHKFREAPLFYTIYTVAHVAGAILVIASVDLVRLIVDVEVMNAMLLPIVLGFLMALEFKTLPDRFRMRGWYRNMVWLLSGVVMAFGVYMMIVSL